MPDAPWQPTEVGELFMLVTSDKHRALMRVVEVRSDGYSATSADMDDAMRADPETIAEVKWTPPTSWNL